MSTLKADIIIVRAKHDILAEAGDFLLIYPDHSVGVLSELEMTRSGLLATTGVTVHRKKRRKPVQHSLELRGESSPHPRRHRIAFEINGQSESLMRHHYESLAAVAKWNQPQPVGRLNNSGQCTFLKKQGYLSHDPNSGLWTLTKLGRDAVMAISGREDAA